MTSSNSDATDYKAIRKQLTRFTCLETPPALSASEMMEVRNALLLFSEAADYETLGVCANTLAEGKAAIETYVTALSRPIQLDLDARMGPVYIKFNTLKGAWYLDDYSGPSRGVLVSFHASDPDADAVNGTYGPFPCNLFG